MIGVFVDVDLKSICAHLMIEMAIHTDQMVG